MLASSSTILLAFCYQKWWRISRTSQRVMATAVGSDKGILFELCFCRQFWKRSGTHPVGQSVSGTEWYRIQASPQCPERNCGDRISLHPFVCPTAPNLLLTILTTESFFVSSSVKKFFNKTAKLYSQNTFSFWDLMHGTCSKHKKQTVESNRRGRISKQKIKEEASKNNRAIDTCLWGHRSGISNTDYAVYAANIQKQLSWAFRKLRRRIKQLKLAREGAEKNNLCWKNQGHLQIWLSFLIEALTVRKLPTLSFSEVTYTLALLIPIKAGIHLKG